MKRTTSLTGMKRLAWTIGVAAALGAAAPTAHAKTEFVWSSFIPWGHRANQLIYVPWKDAVEKATEGRVTFRLLPKPVTSPRGHYDAVRTEQADVAWGTHAYTPKLFAAYDFASLPFQGDDAVATSVALQRTHDKFLAAKGLYAGVKLVGVNTHGPGHFFMRRKHITKPSDLKGLKIRTGGQVPLAMVAGMGGVSVRQPVTKVYELLSTGIVDGLTFPWESVESFRIMPLVPYATEVPGGLYSMPFYLILNRKKWDGLPSADKKAIEPLMGEYFARLAGAGWNKMNGTGRAAGIKQGTKIMPAPAPVVAAVRKINADLEKRYVAAMAKDGMDGAAVINFFRAEAAKLGAK